MTGQQRIESVEKIRYIKSAIIYFYVYSGAIDIIEG